MRPEPADVSAPTILVIACGALVRELRALVSANRWSQLDFTYLPAPLHNRPERIVPGILDVLRDRADDYDKILVGYGDCGTGGRLDAEIERLRAEESIDIERLPGDHCYEFLGGTTRFHELYEEELGTLFLTDYLARHFELLIWRGLGLADHPELLPLYFGNYRRVVLLSQTDDADALAELIEMGRSAADRLGLEFHHERTGIEPFDRAVTSTLVKLTGVN